MTVFSLLSHFFFFNDTATTEIYTLSLHDALPISRTYQQLECVVQTGRVASLRPDDGFESVHRLKPVIWSEGRDRKSTRLNSSHGYISYAVFCLKKKKKIICKIAAHYTDVTTAILV